MISPLAIGAFLDRGYAWNRYYKCVTVQRGPDSEADPAAPSIPLGVSILLAICGWFVFRGCEFHPAGPIHPMGADAPLSADQPPPDEAHDAPMSTAQAPGSTAHDQQGEVFHARTKMSAQQRMKRALQIRAVWVGTVLIICACVPGTSRVCAKTVLAR